MIFHVLFLVYFALSYECAQNSFLSKTYSVYKRDKRIPGYYRQVRSTRVRCSMLCVTNNSCAGFGYDETRLECFLYDRYPVECQGVVIDIGMKIYVSSEEDKTNVAIGKPTAMSSFLRLPYLPCNCVDGNITEDRPTMCHTQQLNPNWFCVDLQKLYNFKQISIFNRDGLNLKRIINFQIRLSSTGACDNSTFNTAPLCHQDPNPIGLLVYNITTCSTAIAFSSRYVFISNHNGRFLNFCEIKVHAY